jgi:hypothetical protein
MTDLESLLARVEAAEGPDREIDALICAALHVLPAGEVCPPVAADTAVEWRAFEDGWVRLYATNGHVRDQHFLGRHADPFTASLDAALALCERVLPGADVSLFTLRSKRPEARVVTDYDEATDEIYVWEDADGATPALALLAALLKALIAQAPLRSDVSDEVPGTHSKFEDKEVETRSVAETTDARCDATATEAQRKSEGEDQ